ncbi:hypothetical protein V8C86DRAFT_3025189 [Haematococcus lacustris]
MRTVGMLPADTTSLTKFRNGVAGPKDTNAWESRISCWAPAGAKGSKETHDIPPVSGDTLAAAVASAAAAVGWAGALAVPPMVPPTPPQPSHLSANASAELELARQQAARAAARRRQGGRCSGEACLLWLLHWHYNGLQLGQGLSGLSWHVLLWPYAMLCGLSWGHIAIPAHAPTELHCEAHDNDGAKPLLQRVVLGGQQLIAQKRAKGQAHKESLAVEKRQRVCTQQSEETEDSEDERMAAAGDPVKDKQKLKRLLRNRVSAQQARERKKQHLNELEEQRHAGRAGLAVSCSCTYTAARLQAARIEQLSSQLSAVRAEADGMRRIIGSMKGASALPPGHPDGGSSPGALAGSACDAVAPQPDLPAPSPASHSSPATQHPGLPPRHPCRCRHSSRASSGQLPRASLLPAPCSSPPASGQASRHCPPALTNSLLLASAALVLRQVRPLKLEAYQGLGAQLQPWACPPPRPACCLTYPVPLSPVACPPPPATVCSRTTRPFWPATPASPAAASIATQPAAAKTRGGHSGSHPITTSNWAMDHSVPHGLATRAPHLQFECESEADGNRHSRPSLAMECSGLVPVDPEHSPQPLACNDDQAMVPSAASSFPLTAPGSAGCVGQGRERGWAECGHQPPSKGPPAAVGAWGEVSAAPGGPAGQQEVPLGSAVSLAPDPIMLAALKAMVWGQDGEEASVQVGRGEEGLGDEHPSGRERGQGSGLLAMAGEVAGVGCEVASAVLTPFAHSWLSNVPIF